MTEAEKKLKRFEEYGALTTVCAFILIMAYCFMTTDERDIGWATWLIAFLMALFCGAIVKNLPIDNATARAKRQAQIDLVDADIKKR